jgi:hypothetical protein
MQLLKNMVYIACAGLYLAILYWVLEWLTHKLTSRSKQTGNNTRYLDSLYGEDFVSGSDQPDTKA